MFQHDFVTAMRDFSRNKFSTTVSIFGLTLGLLCLMGAFCFVYILNHSDQNFAKSARIYFVESQDGNSYIPWKLADYFPTEFSDLQVFARVRSAGEAPLSTGGHGTFASISVAEPAFLRIFDLPFVAGDPQHALDRPRSMVLTRATAQRLYGTTKIVGRPITVRGHDLTVTGVIGDIPQPSHLTTALGIGELVSADLDEQLADHDMHRCGWDCNAYTTYLLFPPGDTLSLDAFNRRLTALGTRVLPPNNRFHSFNARKISEIGAAMLNGGGLQLLGIRTDLLVEILGGLIAVIACINYANLATARIVSRAKEIGLRKVLGAERRHLAAQYLMEAALQVTGSYILVASALALSTPIFSRMFGFNLFAFFARQPATWLFVAASCVLVTVIAGISPVLTVLRIKPEAAIRTGRGLLGKHGSGRVLVGVQFGIVSLLLIVALVMVFENRLLRKAGLESMGDQIVVISNDLKEAGVPFDTFRNEIAHAPGIMGVSAMQFKPWAFANWGEEFQRGTAPNSKPPNASFEAVGYGVAGDFFETMGIKLLAGRSFSPDRAEDQWAEQPLPGQKTDQPAPTGKKNFVIDEAFAAQLGWSPAQAVGQTVYQPSEKGAPQQVHIIGVVANKSFNVAGVAPFAFYVYEPQGAHLPVVRLDRREIPAGLAAIDAAWERLAPGTPLKRDFMDDLFRSAYSIFAGIDAVIFALAAFAFAIAAAGLIGMATFAVTRLRREIGIRKVLGSTVRRALTLVLWDFSKPVVIANVIAWPLAYLVAHVYLSLFAVRITLTPVPFVLGFVIALGMTWLAVGWHAWRAAQVNPAEVLHYE